MRSSIQLKMVVGFGSALAILVLIATLSYRSTRQAIEDSNRVAHTFRVMAAIETIRSLIADAETGQRGYLITGDETFLGPFKAAPARLAEHLHALESLVVGSPNQRKRIDRLRALTKARFEKIGQTIELHRTQGPDAIAVNVAGPGKTQMDQIHDILEQMRIEESWLLDARIDESGRSARDAVRIYVLLILLDFALLGSIFYLVRHDLSERGRSEQMLRRSRERFELAVRGSRDGLWDWDLATNEVYFSPRWKEQLGYRDHEVGNRYEEWESRLHPDDREMALATVRTYLEGRTPQYELEHRLRHKDGSYRWIRARGVALRDERGEPYRMAGSHTDITDRKQAERILFEQNRRLEEAARSEREAHEALKLAQSRMVQSEKLVSLGQMVAGVAHEINNPLGFVLNNVAVLRRDVGEMRDLLALYREADDLLARERPELHDRVRDFADRVDMAYTLANILGLLDRSRDGLRRILQIVQDLRAFARLDEGEVKEADLNHGIESAVTLIQGNARKKQVAIETDLDGLPPVTCNPAQVNQVVMNLLSNAVDACPEGGTVTVRSRVGPDGVRIEVCDTGPGIDPAIRDRIFDPFFTTKPVGEGTGLGLSISYGIVHDHGGSIDVDSQPGRGTCMTVHLPLECPKAMATRAG